MTVNNFALDTANHDIYLDPDGQIALTGVTPGAPMPLNQRIDCRLRTFRGEWWLDTFLGIPWFQEVLKKNPDLAAVKSFFAQEIYRVAGVQTINNLELSLNRATRTLLVIFSVTGTDSVLYFDRTEVAF